MAKYPIKKEIFPLTLLTPPVRDAQSAGKMGEIVKLPGWLWRHTLRICAEGLVENEYDLK